MIVRAPSNIALIKYMGKQDSPENLPANPSLSMTLNLLASFFELDKRESGFTTDQWIDQKISGLPETAKTVVLSTDGQTRIFNHLSLLRKKLPQIYSEFSLKADCSPALNLKSANTFPMASGVASSASSFAALTYGVARVWCEDLQEFDRRFVNDANFKLKLSQLSRMGSGSSCRSFLGPFTTWKEDQVALQKSQIEPLTDLVILVSSEQKKVGSSEAHRRVKTSPLWQGRVNRVQSRYDEMSRAFERGDLLKISDLAWDEFQDMHQLFHTSSPPFSYWQPLTQEILEFLFQRRKRGAIVTMDAGPNIHCIVPSREAAQWEQLIKAQFKGIELLVDTQGNGPSGVTDAF